MGVAWLKGQTDRNQGEIKAGRQDRFSNRMVPGREAGRQGTKSVPDNKTYNEANMPKVKSSQKHRLAT